MGSFDLAPQEPQPWIPVNDTDSELRLARVNRSLDLVLGQSELRARGLGPQGAPFRRHSSSTACYGAALQGARHSAGSHACVMYIDSRATLSPRNSRMLTVKFQGPSS